MAWHHKGDKPLSEPMQTHVHWRIYAGNELKLIPDLSFYCSHFEWPQIWHADVSWLPLELIRFWSSSVDFPHFVDIITQWNGSNLWLTEIFVRMQGMDGLKHGMLMFPDHLQNLLKFSHCLLTFLILASFWLSETCQILGFWWFSSEPTGGMA